MASPYDDLLKDLCVRLGFCGSVVDGRPVRVEDLLPSSGAVTVEAFTDALFRAEGWDPAGADAQKLRPAVEDAFVRHMGSLAIDAATR